MHWKNSRFQIISFIVGSCHTADEAYRKVLLLRDERQQAVNNARITEIKRQAAKLRAESKMSTSADPAERLEAEAALMELVHTQSTFDACLEEAIKEVEFIDSVAERLKPHRKYGHLPDSDAFQAAQREEWCLELLDRAQNYLFCTGTIPPDHFATMRSHPDFGSAIAPAIAKMRAVLAQKENLVLYNFKHPCIKELASDTKLLAGPAMPALRLEDGKWQ